MIFPSISASSRGAPDELCSGQRNTLAARNLTSSPIRVGMPPARMVASKSTAGAKAYGLAVIWYGIHLIFLNSGH